MYQQQACYSRVKLVESRALAKQRIDEQWSYNICLAKIWHNSCVESDLARPLLISAAVPRHYSESFVFHAYEINRLSHH